MASQRPARRIDAGVISPTLLPAVLSAQAKMLEEAGLEGLFAPQVYGPPFAPVATAAAVSSRNGLPAEKVLAYVGAIASTFYA